MSYNTSEREVHKFAIASDAVNNPLEAKFCNGDPILTIHPDGRITVSDELKPDETAAMVLQMVKEQWLADPQAKKIRELQERIKRLEEATQDRDKEWFQVIESVLGFHPVSITDALRIGIERIKKQKQRIKRLEEAGDAMVSEPCEYTFEQWIKAKEAKP